MLSARVILLGSLVGIGLGVANLVFSLKVGFAVGVALAAVTVAGALRQLARGPFTLSEGARVCATARAPCFHIDCSASRCWATTRSASRGWRSPSRSRWRFRCAWCRAASPERPT